MQENIFNPSETVESLIRHAEALPETGKTDILPAAEIRYNEHTYRISLQVEKGPFGNIKRNHKPEYCIRVWASSPSYKHGRTMLKLNTSVGLWPCEADPAELERKIEYVCNQFREVNIIHDIEKTFKINEIERTTAPEGVKVIMETDIHNDLPNDILHDKIYGMYQIDWMKKHSYSIKDLMSSLEEYRTIDKDLANVSLLELMSEWDSESGFNGSLWVCKEEFLQSEYLDKDYIDSLIPLHERTTRKSWERDTGEKLPAPGQEKKTSRGKTR